MNLFLSGSASAVHSQGSLPKLVAKGKFFQTDAGDKFTAIQASDYNLFNRFLKGEDIEPILTQREEIGFNMLRVWTRMKLASAGIGDLTLADHPDLYERVPDFLQAAARHGLHVEFTAYIGPKVVEDDFDPEHWQRLGVAVKSTPTSALLELMNENDQHPIDVRAFSPIPGVLCSRGSNGGGHPPVGVLNGGSNWIIDPSCPPWGYTDNHSNGIFEEQRKVGHAAMEYADCTGTPALTNETSRCPEVGMYSGADLARMKALAYGTAAGGALLGAGSCFHSIQGKSSVLFTGDQLEVARVWVAGAKSVDLSFQNDGYIHDGDSLAREASLGMLRCYRRGSSPYVDIPR